MCQLYVHCTYMQFYALCNMQLIGLGITESLINNCLDSFCQEIYKIKRAEC